MTQQRAARSGAIDLVRLLAVTAIVAGHAWTREVTGDWLYPWHVPVFFILSGYLFAPGRSLRAEATRRLRSLGQPYLFWFLVLTAVLLGRGFDDTGARIIRGMIGGGVAGMPYITFWFVSTLFFVTLLFRAIQPLPMIVRWAIGLAGAVAGWIWGPALSDTPLGIGMAATCLIYLLIGDGLRLLRERIRMPVLGGAVLLAGSAAMIALGWTAPVDIKQGDCGIPVVTLAVSSAISIGLILMAEGLLRPGRVAELCTALALPLLTVVLAHPVVLWTPWPAWLKFVVGMTVPLAVGLVALRTPASRWITGQRRNDGQRRSTVRRRPTSGE